MPTLDELMQEYEAERLAEIAKDETLEAIARREVKRKAEVEREIRQGYALIFFDGRLETDGIWCCKPPARSDWISILIIARGSLWTGS